MFDSPLLKVTVGLLCDQRQMRRRIRAAGGLRYGLTAPNARKFVTPAIFPQPFRPIR
jgi:hypothetical protein